jgi:hypothetical protein
MILILLALAVACVVFWRVALKLLAILAIALIVMGVVMVIQDLHHVVR